MGIAAHVARNKISSIFRQAWDVELEKRGLISYEMANQKIAWWFPDDLIEDQQLRYVDINGKSRRRAVRGTKGKKELTDGSIVPRYHWHLGFTAKTYATESPYFALQPRIIISDDGKNPLESKTKLNSVRRSTTSMWFNEKWRGLVLGFANWLADGESHISLRVAENCVIELSPIPRLFDTEFGIAADPVNLNFDDEEHVKFEEAEIHRRLSDPAFRNLEDFDDE